MSHTPFDISNPTEDHAAIRELVARFTQEAVEPQAEEFDERAILNMDLFRRMGTELGLLGVTIPEEWGGAGLDATAAVIVHHELAKSDPGFTLAYLAHSMLFVNNFFWNSSDEQKKQYLDKVISGEWVGCMCMTEPAVGTDVLGMQTTAVRDGNSWVLNGAKTFITNAPESSIFFIYATVNGRITSFVAERDAPGLSVSNKIPKTGMRGSTMAEVHFDDCRIPAANLMGEEGRGIVHMMRNLEIERLTLAAMSLGIADRCMDVMLRYADERQAFGKPLHHFGQIQRYIGESYARTEAMRSLIYNVARNCHPGNRDRLGSDAAKLFAATEAKQVADNAIQVLGGYGYCQEYKVERLWRDAKLLEIGGGTIEAHQKNITRDLTKRLR